MKGGNVMREPSTTHTQRGEGGYAWPGWRYALLLGMILAGIHIASPVASAQADAAHQQFLFAYKLLQRHDDKLAAEAFDEYLGSFPAAEKRGDAIYYRALLYRRAGDNTKASALLIDVPTPKLVPAYAVDLLRGQVLSDLKQYGKALESLERIDVDKLKPGLAVSVHYLRGLAYRGANNLPAAAKSLTTASKLDTPMQGRALLDLARVQVLMDQPEQAAATLKQSLTHSDPATSAEAARLAGDLSYQQGDYSAAISYYNRVLSQHQTSEHFGPAVLGTLWSQFSAGQYEAVLATFEQYHASLPVQDRITAWYLAGSAQQELGEHAKAAALFEQLTRDDNKLPLQEKSLYKLAVSQFALGQIDAMKQTLATLTQRYPESQMQADIAYLQATADAQQGEVSQGAARLTVLIEQGPSHPYYRQSLLHRARLYEQHGKWQPATDDFARYVAASFEAGDVSEQVQQAALRLVDLQYRLGQLNEAVAAGQSLLEQKNISPATRQEAMYRLGLAQLKQGDAKAALATLDALQQQYPLNPFASQTTYYRGLLLMSLSKPEAAAKLLNQAGDDAKLSAQMRTSALRLLALRQRDSDANAAAQTLAKLETLVGITGMTDAELLWLGERELTQGDPAKAAAYLKPVQQGRDGTVLTDRAHAIYLTGKAHRQLGSYEDAANAFQHVIALGKGHDLEARLQLAKTLRDQKHDDEALAEYAGLISADASEIAAEALFDSGLIYRQRAADRRLQDDQAGMQEANTEARRLLKRMVLLYPFKQLEPLPQLAYLELAEIAAELGEMPAATGELQELIDKYPDGPYADFARAVLAADRQRYGEAVALLHRLRDTNEAAPLDPRLNHRVQSLLRILEPKR